MTDPESRNNRSPADEFNELVGAIDEHNARFSAGNAMAGMFMEMFNMQQRAYELQKQDELPSESAERIIATDQLQKPGFSDQQEMAQDVLQLNNTPALANLGLKLTPVRSEMVLMGPLRGNEEVGPVRLQLEDADKFSAFLSALSLEHVTPTTTENIQKVVSSILRETEDAIESHSDGEFVLETLAGASKIIEALERLGLADSPAAKRLMEYSEHSKKGDLTEFVSGTKMQLFRSPQEQQFGPSQWQGDATAEYLQGRWDEAISLLEQAKTNPNGADIFAQLMAGAKESLAAAKQDWSERKGKSSIEGYGATFDGVFNEVASKLQQLEQAEE